MRRLELRRAETGEIVSRKEKTINMLKPEQTKHYPLRSMVPLKPLADVPC